jgi:hypothetical protein
VVVQRWPCPAGRDEVLDNRDLVIRLLAAQEYVGPELFVRHVFLLGVFRESGWYILRLRQILLYAFRLLP